MCSPFHLCTSQCVLQQLQKNCNLVSSLNPNKSTAPWSILGKVLKLLKQGISFQLFFNISATAVIFPINLNTAKSYLFLKKNKLSSHYRTAIFNNFNFSLGKTIPQHRLQFNWPTWRDAATTKNDHNWTSPQLIMSIPFSSSSPLSR